MSHSRTWLRSIPVLVAPLAVRVATLAALIVLAPESGAQTTRDVRMLPSSPGVIRLAVDVPTPVLEPAEGTSGRMRLTVDGYEGVAPEGRPQLPQRVVVVAVPASGEVSVSATAAEAEVTHDLRLVLVPLRLQGRKGDPEPGEAEALTEAMADAGGSTAGGAEPLASGVRARLLEVGWMRNQRIARIAVTPADYDLAGGTLSIARRIDVQVVVSGAAEVPAAASLPGPAEEHDPFERVYQGTCVNYEQGRAWRRSGPGRRPFESSGTGPGGAVVSVRAAGPVPDTSVYGGRQWVKIAIDASGFYSIRFAVLRNLGLFSGNTTTRLDSLRLFTWPGLPVLPEQSYCDSCDYREVAMGFVEQTVNGVFDDGNDYLYFYALGASDWASIYDPAQADTVFINHPYETTNYYYLTIATAGLPVGGTPKRIQTQSGDPAQATGGETIPATFDARIHQELDQEYWPNAWPNPRLNSNLFWERWFWRNITMGEAARDFSVDAPGVDVTRPSQLRMRCWGVTELILRKSFGIADHYFDVGFNGHPFARRAWDGLWAQTYDTTLVGLIQPTNTLTMSVPRITDPSPALDKQRVDVTALAWYDLFYARRFEPVADALTFDSPVGGGTYLYHLGPFTLPDATPPRVFDVTDPLAPIQIQSAQYKSGGLDFYRAEAGRHRYQVLPDTRLKPLTGQYVYMAPASSLNNLRAEPDTNRSGADYLIIYYDRFQAAAESLAVWRSARLPLDKLGPFATATVPISAVYDQFSGGRSDPGAIRNFLRAAFYNWNPRPAFVTLFGDASYDFKNIGGYAPLGEPGTLLPAYEGGYVEYLSSQYATDDWMLNVDDPVTVIPDYFGGRIPALDPAGALAFVQQKLLPYERSAPTGEWRNRVMLIADDNEQGSQPDGLGWLHVRQTAALDTAVTPKHIDRAYVYLHTYPDGPNDTKPLAKKDITRNANDGVIMWNYIGHGSPFKIADESAFLTTDASALTNTTRPGLFVAASCDVGKFHDPTVQSLGEILVMNPVGGCISVVSATELAFSGENAELNKTLYRQIFNRDPLGPSGGQYHLTIADALLSAKTGSQNSQKYQLMGDAATRLLLPRMWVELTLKDSSGAPVDTLRRGELVSFDGRVVDRPGGTLVSFNGSAAMLVEDSAPIDTTPPCAVACTRERYPWRAAPAFRGDARVLNGSFSGRFVVPLDAVLGPRGRVRGYVSGEAVGTASSTDGAGSHAFALVSGGPPAGDNEGPRIGLAFSGGATAVRPDATLRIELSDDHGILITGHSAQNGIIVTMDGNSNTRVDVTSSFRYAADSYREGTASFRLPGLANGRHTISVSAADNLASGIRAAQHRSSGSIDFDVSEQPPLSVQRAFLFPNPTRSGGVGGGGTFVIDAPGDSVNVLLNVYTITGRLIRTLKAFAGLGQIQVPWDGLDAEGDPLANGTYLFRVQVNGRDADGSSSAKSRAAAEGKIVVTSH